MSSKPFIVAEISANHLGSLKRALELVEVAEECGADAVKFQTYTPEQMVAPDTVIQSGPWAGRNALELYREAHTPREWHPELFRYARKLGLLPFSSVFHPDDIEFLETLGCQIYKISSFELTDHALIRYAVRTGKAMIISTGMATLSEIAGAVHAAAGCRALTLLKCTSAYPASAADANLAAGVALTNFSYGTKWGLSDHSPGNVVAVAAAALGATVIEKHLTLARADGGLDAAFSMEPSEFAEMVARCREAVSAIGTVRYGTSASEASSLPLRRGSGGKRGSLTSPPVSSTS